MRSTRTRGRFYCCRRLSLARSCYSTPHVLNSQRPLERQRRLDPHKRRRMVINLRLCVRPGTELSLTSARRRVTGGMIDSQKPLMIGPLEPVPNGSLGSASENHVRSRNDQPLVIPDARPDGIEASVKTRVGERFSISCAPDVVQLLVDAPHRERQVEAGKSILKDGPKLGRSVRLKVHTQEPFAAGWCRRAAVEHGHAVRQCCRRPGPCSRQPVPSGSCRVCTVAAAAEGASSGTFKT